MGCHFLLQGIFLTQGWNPCLLCHLWQVDSLELEPPGNCPCIMIVMVNTCIALQCSKASLVAQRLKRLPAMQKTWVRSLGREDPLEKEMATHSNIFAWRIPWTEETGGLQSTGSQRVGHDWATSLHFTSLQALIKSYNVLTQLLSEVGTVISPREAKYLALSFHST